jgi:electron transport complex protein RnfG
MSEQNPNLAMPSSGLLIRTLTIISLVCGALVAASYEYSKPFIAGNQRIALEGALSKVLPPEVKNRLTFRVEKEHLKLVPDTTVNNGDLVYAGFDKDHKLISVALAAAAQGYQDMVKLLYSYNPYSGCITGFTVLKTSETPGFGTEISTNPGFLANFKCLDAKVNPEQTALIHAIKTVRNGTKKNAWEIDAISGATITSNAVGRMLNKSGQTLHPAIIKNLKQLENADLQQPSSLLR